MVVSTYNYNAFAFKPFNIFFPRQRSRAFYLYPLLMLIKIFDFLLNFYFLFCFSLFFTNYSFILSGLQKKFSYLPEDISNISIQTIVFLGLLIIRWSIDRAGLFNMKFIRLIKRIGSLDDKIILWFIFTVFLTIFVSIGIARHLALSSSGYDLAVTDQALWNTTKGRILFSSLDGNISHLGAHFEPILFFIVPIYVIWPNIIALIIIQSLALGIAIFPLYSIAKSRLNNRILIFAFIISYFLSRSTRGIGLLDFHTDSLIVPLIFFSFYFLITKRTGAALLLFFLMLLCKENVAFIVIGLAIFILIFQKRYKLGIFLLISGISYWIIITNYIMPYFANTQSYPYLTWLPFGETYLENIKAILRNPLLLKECFLNSKKIEFYLRLFGPLGFLSFFSLQHYILFLVPLFTHIIGSIAHPGMQTISSHYPAHTIPFIFIAAIYGAAWIISKSKLKKAPIYLSVYILTTSLLFHGKTDGHKFAKFIRSAKEIHATEIISDLRIIPQEASVCAVNVLVPHLSHRKYIYIWEDIENCKYNTQYIVIHKDFLESTKDSILEITNILGQKGYKNIIQDKYNSLCIFFNPDIDNSLLENEPRKIIPMKRDI